MSIDSDIESEFLEPHSNTSPVERNQEAFPLTAADMFSDNEEEVEYYPMAAGYIMEILRDLRVTRAASKRAMEGLQKVKIGERKTSLVTCSVCLEDISIGTEAGRLPCSHVYHTDCIVKWLQKKNQCPLCRCEISVL